MMFAEVHGVVSVDKMKIYQNVTYRPRADEMSECRGLIQLMTGVSVEDVS